MNDTNRLPLYDAVKTVLSDHLGLPRNTPETDALVADLLKVIEKRTLAPVQPLAPLGPITPEQKARMLKRMAVYDPEGAKLFGWKPPG